LRRPEGLDEGQRVRPETYGQPLGTGARLQEVERHELRPTGPLPRLVASGVLGIGTTRSLDLVNAGASSLGVHALALCHTLPVPAPRLGCDVWLDLLAPVATTAVITSAPGIANLPFTAPNNPGLIGLQLSAQSGVAAAAIGMTNALDLIVN